MKRNLQRRSRWLPVWLLACIMTLGGTNAWADGWTYNGTNEITSGVNVLEVTASGQELTITGNITIGSDVINLPPDGMIGAYKITGIGENAFDSASLLAINIPGTVKTIGKNAFYNCDLKTVILKEGLETIGESAFKDCKDLTKVTIPKSVTTIGLQAFYECTSLREVTFEDGLTIIGTSMFMSTALESVDIPGSVETIGVGAFSGISTLKSVTLNEGLKDMGIGTFMESGLTEITLPSTVEKIDQFCFQECASLTTITLNEGLTTIGLMAFQASGLTSVTIPSTVTTMDGGAFKACVALASIEIPGSITQIPVQCFNGCEALLSITYKGETPPTIGTDAFATTTSPVTGRNVYLPNGDQAQTWTPGDWGIADMDHFIFSIWIFDPAQKTLTMEANGKTIVLKNMTAGSSHDLTIGENSDYAEAGLEFNTIKDAAGASYTIVGIGANAFKNNTKLTSLTLPATVTSIGDNAFKGATLEQLHLQCVDSTVIALGDIALDKNCVVYVPKGKLTSGNFYVPTGGNGTYKTWNDFTYILAEGDKLVTVSYKDKDGNAWPYNDNLISDKSFLATKAPVGQMFGYFLGHADADSTIVIEAGNNPNIFAYQDTTVNFMTTTEDAWVLTVKYIVPIKVDQSDQITIKPDGKYNQDSNPTDDFFNGTIKDTQTTKLVVDSDGDTEIIAITLNDVSVTGTDAATEIVTNTSATLNLEGDNILGTLTNNGTLILTSKDRTKTTLDVTEVTNAGILKDSTGLVTAVKGEANLSIGAMSDQILESGGSVKLEAEAEVEGNSSIWEYIWFKKETDGTWTQVKPTVAPTALGLRDGTPVDADNELTVNSSDAGNYRCQITATNADLSVLTILSVYAKVTVSDPAPDPANYSVTLPKIEGATTDPEAGIHWVTEGENWKFSLKLDSAYSQSTPIVKANDKVIEPNTDGFYVINWIYANQTITVTGIVKNTPVGNAEVEANKAKVWSSDGALCIHTPQPARVRVVSFSGNVYKDLGVVSGDASIAAPRGSYIVIVGNETFKIAL